ncbi:T9SS type A sorting domain-containing protein, partial [Flavivirga aquimarina]
GDDLYIAEISGNRISKLNLGTLSINENIEVSNIKLYPNPSPDFIQISGLPRTENYTIYNILGTKISSGIISNNEKIDIKKSPNGLYFLKFENGNTFKFIKK